MAEIAAAKELVNKYYHRPEFELFDCDADPLEMNNLAGQTQHAATMKRLKVELDRWMAAQGDLGKQTELDTIMHQGRYKNMTPEEARAAYEKRLSGGKKKKQKAKKKKKAA